MISNANKALESRNLISEIVFDITYPWSSNRGRGRVPPGSESDGWMDGAVDKRAQI